MIVLLFAACTDYAVNAKDDGAEAGGDSDSSAPKILVDPERIDFGGLAVGSSAEPQVVTVQNVGDADLYVSGIDVVGAGFTTTSLGGPWLSPGDSDTFVVTYTAEAQGVVNGTVTVHSDDPDWPAVDVELAGEGLVPDIDVSPATYDFGTLEPGASASMDVTVTNTGSATLTVDLVDWQTGTPEMVLSAGTPSAFTLDPGATQTYTITYTPTDDVADEAFLSFTSDDPDEPVATANVYGNGRIFEGFSTGWYIVDDSTNYETTSNPSYVVDTYGDSDGYWYEPSGAHGLVDSADPTTDFATLRAYVIARAGAPVTITGPLTFHTTSTVPTFSYASFSYIVCDFWLDSTDDPALYEVTTGTVDDGLRVMVNGVVLGDITLGGSGAFSIADVAVPGAVNTLAVILEDNSQVDKYVNELAFYRDGVIVSD